MLESIMCIDDDPITSMLFKKVVQKTSFAKKIINATNGKEAMMLINKIADEETHPQLLFLDLNMPVIGGWEFLDLFNNSNYYNLHHTKIIILSSTIDPDDVEKSKSYPNVIGFFSKPITIEILDHLNSKI